MACAKLTIVSILTSSFLSSHCLYSPSPGECLTLVGVQWRRFSFDYFMTDIWKQCLGFLYPKAVVLEVALKRSPMLYCFTELTRLKTMTCLTACFIEGGPCIPLWKSHSEWILLGIDLWFLQLFKRDIPSWISVTTTKPHSHCTGVENYTKPHSVLGGQVCTHCIRECVILAQVP